MAFLPRRGSPWKLNRHSCPVCPSKKRSTRRSEHNPQLATRRAQRRRKLRHHLSTQPLSAKPRSAFEQLLILWSPEYVLVYPDEKKKLKNEEWCEDRSNYRRFRT